MANITCRVSGIDPSAGHLKRVAKTFKLEDWRQVKPYAKTLEEARTAWYVRVRLNGGDRVNKRFASREDAIDYERSIETDKQRGVALDPRSGQIPFKTFATEWLTSDPSKRGSSLARDKAVVNGYLIPHFESRPLITITYDDVQKLVATWSKTLMPATVGRMFTTLQAVMSAAVRSKRIPESPCVDIRLPEHSPRESLILMPEVVALLAQKVGAASAPMVYIGAVLGLRWGEVAGLRAGNLDLESGWLRVTGQRTRGERGQMIEGVPKTRAGIRPVAMPPELVAILKAHLAARGLTESDTTAYLFVGAKGAPLHYSNWRRRVWVPACEALGLEGFHFHDLRHNSATALAHAGVDAKTAAAMLGTDVAVMQRIYAQVTSESSRRAANAVGAHFFPVAKNRPKIGPSKKRKAS